MMGTCFNPREILDGVLYRRRSINKAQGDILRSVNMTQYEYVNRNILCVTFENIRPIEFDGFVEELIQVFKCEPSVRFDFTFLFNRDVYPTKEQVIRACKLKDSRNTDFVFGTACGCGVSGHRCFEDCFPDEWKKANWTEQKKTEDKTDRKAMMEFLCSKKSRVFPVELLKYLYCSYLKQQ